MRRRRERDDRGAAAVEFALISIPFILLVFGMIQYGWFFYVSQTTASAASTVARQLQVGDCWSGTEALDRAREQAPMVDSLEKRHNGVVVNALPAGAAAGDLIEVRLTADGRILGLVPMPGDGQIDKTVDARLEDKTAEGC